MVRTPAILSGSIAGARLQRIDEFERGDTLPISSSSMDQQTRNELVIVVDSTLNFFEATASSVWAQPAAAARSPCALAGLSVSTPRL
jgi:hypothetical protein